MAYTVQRRAIIVRTTFDAVHQWQDAPADTGSISSILQYPHRHVFHVEVRVPVTDPDRQIEFLQFKEVLDFICRDKFQGLGGAPVKVLPYSCESMAEIIGKGLLGYDHRLAEAAWFTVTVYEDNENGGEVTFE